VYKFTTLGYKMNGYLSLILIYNFERIKSYCNRHYAGSAGVVLKRYQEASHCHPEFCWIMTRSERLQLMSLQEWTSNNFILKHKEACCKDFNSTVSNSLRWRTTDSKPQAITNRYAEAEGSLFFTTDISEGWRTKLFFCVLVFQCALDLYEPSQPTDWRWKS